MYKLVATNEQGASIFFNGKTIKETLNKFDIEYHRSGWQIHIENSEGIIIKIIRNSFRKSNFHCFHHGYK